MKKTIRVLHFPPLTWRQGTWVGKVKLPSWASSFQDGGPYQLEVFAEDQAPPTPEQAAAFRYLLDNEASVTAAVVRALLQYYPRARARCIDAYGGDSACIAEVEAILPEVITDAAGFRGLVGLSFVYMLSVARDGTAYVGFQLGYEWDEEHGGGVLMHRDRVVLIDSAIEASNTYVAQKDAERAE
jgi:hypothetical protein